MSQEKIKEIPVSEMNIPLQRETFMINLIRELSGLLEDVVGLDEASGFISVVGQNIGNDINTIYKQAIGLPNLDNNQIQQVLQDLKQRINGEFYVIEANEERIVFGNKACPFGEMVKGRESLCMMTSNVFGTIAAQNTGYARVALEETIARGDAGCRVVVTLSSSGNSEDIQGREYFGV